MEDQIIIPYCKIHPNKISFFNSYEYCNKKISCSKDFEDDYDENLKYSNFQESGGCVGLEYYGIQGFEKKEEIQKRTKQKIENAINWLLEIATNKTLKSLKTGKNYQFKISFVTLTLSSQQRHSDYFVKENMLAQFIRELKIYYAIKNYLWRAESQVNGNIHFHIVLDKFVPWGWIKKTWNRIQNKYNYVDNFSNKMQKKYQNGFIFDENHKYKKSYAEQLATYRKSKKVLWTEPNSTDVHSIKNIKNIGAYLSKYCTKDQKNGNYAIKNENSNRYYLELPNNETRLIEGQLWNLSASLSKIKGCKILLYDIDIEEITALKNYFFDKLRFYDFCQVLYITIDDLKKFHSEGLLNELNTYIKDVSS